MFLPHPLCKLLYDQLSFATFLCKAHKYSSNLDFCWTHQTWGDLGYSPLLFTSVQNEIFQKAVIPQRQKSWWKVMLPGWGTKLSFLSSYFLKFDKSESISSLRRFPLCCKAVQEPYRVRHTTYISSVLSLCPLSTEFLYCFEEAEYSCPLMEEAQKGIQPVVEKLPKNSWEHTKALKGKDLSLDAIKGERNSTEKWGEIGRNTRENYRSADGAWEYSEFWEMLEQILPELKSEIFWTPANQYSLLRCWSLSLCQ